MQPINHHLPESLMDTCIPTASLNLTLPCKNFLLNHDARSSDGALSTSGNPCTTLAFLQKYVNVNPSIFNPIVSISANRQPHTKITSLMIPHTSAPKPTHTHPTARGSHVTPHLGASATTSRETSRTSRGVPQNGFCGSHGPPAPGLHPGLRNSGI